MPSCIIHVAIAKEYIRKNKDIKLDYDELAKGSIYPDFAENKSISHYGNWGPHQVDTYIERFLNDENVDLSKDYFKGYFLHLYADNIFYKCDFKEEYIELVKNNDYLYEDYYYINKEIINRYDLKVWPKEMDKYATIKEGKIKYLTNINKVFEFIDKISSINIYEEAEKILNKR